ncbi:peptidoglycan-binding protein [Nostocales cyanobacterium LEGE 11386]|nr:peptidoglycan-binding protein [Nostocales cyanobacterium LEGE 11386]
MDTLAYLHLAETYEGFANSELETITGSDLFFQEIEGENKRGGALMLLLSFAVGMGSFSWSNTVLALKKGNKNSQVISLQQKLQAAGYFKHSVTGYFGTVTEAAVIKFQKDNGLVADGIAGTQTLSAIASGLGKPKSPPALTNTASTLVTNNQSQLGNSTQLLRKGNKNSQVMSLQQKLQTSGYLQESITGYFGTATEAAVVRFQKDHGLVADGIAGPLTLSALASNSGKVISSSSQTTASNPLVTDSPKQVENQVKKDDIGENTASYQARMTLAKTISGKISPKSVVHSGNGLFFAQNMMYNHTITVYNREHQLVKIIPDEVDLSKYGYSNFKGNYKGAPVEASFSHDGKYAWVSNYKMYGPGFNKPGSDTCHPSQKTDRSFLYRINTETLDIDNVIQVGSVPKFVATSADERLVLVSNWCSWDLSVVDTEKNQEIKRVKLGAYPRGIVVDAASEKAYVAVMGSYEIAEVDLRDFSVKWLKNIGRSPRHLNIDPASKYLYASLNGEGKIAKISLPQGKVINKISTGKAPRSMVLSDDGQRLYVVNYGENTVSKVRTSDMKVVQKVNVDANPIGITYDPQTRKVWVACYSGNILVFQD